LISDEHIGGMVDDLARSDQVVLVAAVADAAAEPFDGAPRPDRLGLVLGDEDQGIEPQWLARCRRIVTIPMRPGAGSLNVAVAAGILLQALTTRARRPNESPGETSPGSL
jgi:tRNA G18 (ribose-2'-O)-methylase SpoU